MIKEQQLVIEQYHQWLTCEVGVECDGDTALESI